MNAKRECESGLKGKWERVSDKMCQRTVVYFDQLLGAARTQKLVETLLFTRFQLFLLIFNLFQ